MHKHPGSCLGHGFPYSKVRLPELLRMHTGTGTGEFIRGERNCSCDGQTAPEAMMFRGRSTGHIACAYKHPKLKQAREVRKLTSRYPQQIYVHIASVELECRLLGKCGEEVLGRL
jgi:hypothetical protein